MLCAFLWKKLRRHGRLTFYLPCGKVLKCLLNYLLSFTDFFLHFIVNPLGNRYFKGAVDSLGFSGFFETLKAVTDICAPARSFSCKVKAYFALSTADNSYQLFFRLLFVATATASHRDFLLFQTFSPLSIFELALIEATFGLDVDFPACKLCGKLCV